MSYISEIGCSPKEVLKCKRSLDDACRNVASPLDGRFNYETYVRYTGAPDQKENAMRNNIGKAELDHIFLIVRDETQAHSMMDQAGLRVNYSRVHPGQGTRNICACLDDVFIELLWSDGSEVSPETRQVTLDDRCNGRGSPLGVSWRGTSPFDAS